MTALADHLIRRIAKAGPITVADYMAECLLHPEFGYYTTRPPFGEEGDFTTAPEISQMFGELIGLALAQAWMDQGAPGDAILAELGPGRGTLMADILRVLGQVPGARAALSPHLVEASPHLREIQAETLPVAPHWHDRVTDLPDGPLFLVANEFFDALPIRQFERDPGGWRERQVGQEEERLTMGLGPPAPIAQLDDRLADTAPGDIVELCPQAPVTVSAIAQRIATFGGAAVLIDYGGWHSRGDTLQALRGHRPDPPLAHPGEADLTAHVDFEPLALTAKAHGCAVSELTPQGVFLERLGITARAQALAKGLSGKPLESHIAAHRRLTHPDEMGNLFKVLALTPTGVPPVAGTEGSAGA